MGLTRGAGAAPSITAALILSAVWINKRRHRSICWRSRRVGAPAAAAACGRQDRSVVDPIAGLAHRQPASRRRSPPPLAPPPLVDLPLWGVSPLDSRAAPRPCRASSLCLTRVCGLLVIGLRDIGRWPRIVTAWQQLHGTACLTPPAAHCDSAQGGHPACEKEWHLRHASMQHRLSHPDPMHLCFVALNNLQPSARACCPCPLPSAPPAGQAACCSLQLWRPWRASPW